jgi:hypothetical protein
MTDPMPFASIIQTALLHEHRASPEVLRDFFAALAMHALKSDGKLVGISTPEHIAEMAYKQADAMLKVRAK